MAALTSIIRRSRRRATADLAIRGAGRGLAFAATAGAGLLLADRLGMLAVNQETYPVLILLLVGLLAGSAAFILRRPGRFEMAVTLDRRLDLKDRLGTAEAIRRGGLTDNGFGALVLDDAARLAESIDPAPATPIRVTRVWLAAAGAVAGLMGVAYLPTFGGIAAGPGLAPAGDLRERQRIATAIGEVVSDLKEEIPQEFLTDQEQRELGVLTRLAEQLSAPGGGDPMEPDPAQARDQSAAQLSEMSDRMAREAQQSLDAIDRATRQFARLPDATALDQVPPKLGQFTEALKRGDLGEAAERFDELIDHVEKLPPDSRQRLAEELRRIASQLQQSADPPPETADAHQTQKKIAEALRDLGLDEETIDEQLAPTDQEMDTAANDRRDDRTDYPSDAPEPPETPHTSPTPDTTDTTDSPGSPGSPETADQIDEETARRIAQDLQRLRDERARNEQAQRLVRRAAEALNHDADLIEEPLDTRIAPTGEEAANPPGDRPVNPRSPAPPAPRPPPASGTPPSEPAGRPPGEVPPDAATERRAESDRPPQSPDANGPDRDRSSRSVSRMLRELQESRGDQLERLRASKRLREAARRLADSLSPEEQERLVRQWLGDTPTTPATPTTPIPGATDPGLRRQGDAGEMLAAATEDLDLRGGAEPDIPIARWLADEPGSEQPLPTQRRQMIVRRAQATARQAVERSSVPSRYHPLIQRYFGTLPETVDRAVSAADNDTP